VSHRVYLDTPLEPGRILSLPAANAHHLLNVLRLKNGAGIVLFNGRDDEEFTATLTIVNRREATATIERRHPVQRESALRISLVQAISSGDKMDFTLQKSVELGVADIIPIHSERSARIPAKRLEKRLQHWQRIIISATEQCGRVRLARLHPPARFGELLTSTGNIQARRILAPTADRALSRSLTAHDNPVQIWIGPEGGFSPDEIRAAEKAGIQPVTLGPRILRTETAGIAALSALQALYGDWSGDEEMAVP